MTEKRIPKVGEVWTLKTDTGTKAHTRTVWCVGEGHVAVENNGGSRGIVPISYVLENYDPPEPTVVESAWIHADAQTFAVYYMRDAMIDTHRLDLMSDGEFRVVRL